MSLQNVGDVTAVQEFMYEILFDVPPNQNSGDAPVTYIYS